MQNKANEQYYECRQTNKKIRRIYVYAFIHVWLMFNVHANTFMEIISSTSFLSFVLTFIFRSKCQRYNLIWIETFRIAWKWKRPSKYRFGNCGNWNHIWNMPYNGESVIWAGSNACRYWFNSKLRSINFSIVQRWYACVLRTIV